MFEIGELVELKKTGVVNANRFHKDKVCGIVCKIERDHFRSYTGSLTDKITVLWLPLNEKETMPENFIQKLNKDA